MMVNPVWFVAGGACAIAGISAWGATAPSSQLFRANVRQPGGRGSMALHFDDGPNPSATPQLLELLAKYGVKATFFVIGRQVRVFPALAREIVERGHEIGNHTETHPSLLWLTSAGIADELDRCDEAISSAAGGKARWVRAPDGYRHPLLDGGGAP